MSTVTSMLPAGPDLDLDRAVSVLDQPTAEPFSDVVVDFCAEFSRALSKAAKGYPELQALAFWMRRAELVRLREEFRALETDRTILVPAGSAFHIPPANVDTIFIYSWMLSLLCGNANMVRLSSRSTQQTDLIVGVLDSLMAEDRFTEVRDHNAMVGYGHDTAITDAFSAACDVRVIWGGDDSVRRIRNSPLAPAGSDLTFSDRVSLAVMSAEYVTSLDDQALDALATAFYNDSYWFDQLGCSSPRLVVWVGDDERRRAAEDRFFAAFDGVIVGKDETAETGTAIAKKSFAFAAAIDLTVAEVTHRSNELTVMRLDRLEDVSGEFCGGGAFFSYGAADLSEVAGVVERRYQTVSHAGFTTSELTELARGINGRGVDRFVPVGQALTFNRYWDGKDLLQQFTRRVYIEGDS